MNPVGIIAEYLQSIPPKVRKIILLVFALVVVVVQLLQLFDVGLDYEKINEVLAIVGGYLGLQSAANVPSRGDEADVPPDDTPVAPNLREPPREG